MAETQKATAKKSESRRGHRPGQVSGETRADTPTQPGDAPADTVDPNEKVAWKPPSQEEIVQAQREGILTVPAHVGNGEVIPQEDRDDSDDRWEEYEHQGVTIRHNLDTGESIPQG
jgi:hypothetical protein